MIYLTFVYDLYTTQLNLQDWVNLTYFYKLQIFEMI